MRRRLFNIAATISLLLFAATVALWVRSYQVEDYLDELRYFSHEGTEVECDSKMLTQEGAIVYCRLENTITNSSWREPQHFWQRHRNWQPPQPYYRDFLTSRLNWPTIAGAPLDESLIEKLGFHLDRIDDGSSIEGFVVRIPLWPPAAATFVMPALWCIGRIRKHRRSKKGHCRICGYDLTGNQSGTCPECGACEPSAQPSN
jgi:hypothetical protein